MLFKIFELTLNTCSFMELVKNIQKTIVPQELDG